MTRRSFKTYSEYLDVVGVFVEGTIKGVKALKNSGAMMYLGDVGDQLLSLSSLVQRI